MGVHIMLRAFGFMLTLLIPSYGLAGSWAIDQQAILASAPNLDKNALRYAIKGYQYAKTHTNITKPGLLTIINFNKPSYRKRLWVININTNKVLINTYTTQGRNSGDPMAKLFSNQPNSLKTSLGVYKTLKPYYGKYGYSLRLSGLEPGINNNAYKRAIVIHPAWYASTEFVLDNHRAGTSWGCFAVDPALSRTLVKTIAGGSVIFAYGKGSEKDGNISI